MNAISSSVNKGAFKVAPKAGGPRRQRRPIDRADEHIRARSESISRELSTPQDSHQDNQPEHEGRSSEKTDGAAASSTTSGKNLGAPLVTSTRRASLSRGSVERSESAFEHSDGDRVQSTRSRNANFQEGQDLAPINSTPFHIREPESSTEVELRERLRSHLEDDRVQGNHATADESTIPMQVEDTRTPKEIKEEETELARHRRRTSTRRRAREPTPETAELETINRGELRMVDLCKDLRKGRKSAKYEQFKKIAAERRRQQRLANAQARGQVQDVAKISDSPMPDVVGDAEGATGEKIDEDAAEDEEDEDEQTERTLFVPDVASGAPRTRVVNGQIVIDPTSLQVDRAIRDAAPDDEPVVYIEENPLERTVNSRTYSKRTNSSRWDAESTLLFYTGLSQWGTDFDMISRMIPGRTRKQIKSKYTIEERRNPDLVTQALVNKEPVDIIEYSRLAEVDYKSVEQLESDLADLKQQFETEREEAMREAQQRKTEMQDQITAQAVIEEPAKKKSRRKIFHDGVEIVGDNETLEAQERAEAAARAAQDSDYEDA